MANENKVTFNLKNVHYAKLTHSGSTASWGTPVAVPGAVSLSLSPSGDMSPFYADGIKYFVSNANNGYEGELSLARVPDAMRKDIWNVAEDVTDKVLYEDASVEPAEAALLFQIDGDQDSEYYVLYDCYFGRPAINGQTNAESKEVQAMSCNVNAVPLPENYHVMARTGKDTTTTVKAGWFNAVWTA